MDYLSYKARKEVNAENKERKEQAEKRQQWMRKQFQGTYKTPEGFVALEAILAMCDTKTSSLEVAKQIYAYLLVKPDYQFNLKKDIYDE